jgi:hypothetical protein
MIDSLQVKHCNVVSCIVELPCSFIIILRLRNAEVALKWEMIAIVELKQ